MSILEWIAWCGGVVRRGIRKGRRAWMFALAVVGLIGFAAGFSTAVFAVLDEVVIQATPFTRASDLFEVRCSRNSGGDSCSLLTLQEIATSSAVVDEIAHLGFGSGRVQRPGREPRTLATRAVSSGFFATFGLRPKEGRWFLESDNRDDRRLAVLSERVLESFFGPGETAVGSTILIGRQSYTVVGVMPREFAVPDSGVGVWTLDPLTMRRLERGNAFNLVGFARTRPGITGEQLRTDLERVAGIVRRSAYSSADFRYSVRPIRQALLGVEAKVLSFFFLGTMGLLLMVCANLAGLFAARQESAARETWTRRALGASRSRVIAETVLEQMVLSLPATGIAIGTSVLLLGAFQGLGGMGLSRVELATVGWRAGAVALALSLVAVLLSVVPTAVLAQFWPRRTQGLYVGALNQRRPAVVAQVLLVVQMTLAVILCTSGFAAARLLWTVWNRPLAFEAKGLYAIDLPPDASPSLEASRANAQRILTEVREIPGISRAALGSSVPLGRTVRAPVVPMLVDQEWVEGPRTRIQTVSTDYFDVVQIPVVAGSASNGWDSTGDHCVCVVNEAFGSRFAPNTPMGQIISANLKSGAAAQQCRIVGVVANASTASLAGPVDSELYLSTRHVLESQHTLLVRTIPDRATVENLQARLATSFNGEILQIVDVDQSRQRHTARDRLLGYAGSVFALLAVAIVVCGLLAMVGLYLGVRSRDIAIRLAVGAGWIDVVMAAMRAWIVSGVVALVIGTGLAGKATEMFTSLSVNSRSIGPDARVALAAAIFVGFMSIAAIPAIRLSCRPLVSLLKQER